jgi:hypothetical protein
MTDEFALFQHLFSRQEAVFVTAIYAALPKLFALRRGFRPDFFDNSIDFSGCGKSYQILLIGYNCDPLT